ncbi:MAG: aminopeptidase N C-terminal domain-containing protein, partial [Candidatus Kapaibacterium sp.]
PAEAVLAEEVVARGEIIDPEAIFQSRLALRRHLATVLRDKFESLWQSLAPTDAYAPEGAQVGRRALLYSPRSPSQMPAASRKPSSTAPDQHCQNVLVSPRARLPERRGAT